MICGAAGIRTRVQTRRPYAFYMLSSDLIFGYNLDQSHRIVPYLLYLTSHAEKMAGKPWICSTSESASLRTRASGRCLVPVPRTRIRL